MPRSLSQNLPAPVVAFARRLEDYRNNPCRQRRLPEELWIEATRLAQEYGVHRVGEALRLNYHDLKKRMSELKTDKPERSGAKPAGPAFVELQVPPLAALAGAAVLELEDGRGRKLTLRLATEESTKLAAAISALWGCAS